jgi:rhodanese-related sulfurtransferase
MKTLLQMIFMGAAGTAIGLLANSLSTESLPLLASADQFEMEVDAEIQVASSDIQDLWLSGEALFVDARGADAYAEGRIPGAFSLPYQGFDDGAVPEMVDYLPRDQMLVIYCDGADCHASQVVYDKLLELGFKAEFMKIFHGGWDEWKRSGVEVESDNG